MLIVTLGVLLAATAVTAPAQAAAPPQQRASISVDSKACTVTAKFTYKNSDPATFQYAEIDVYTPDGNEIAGEYSTNLSDTIFVTVSGDWGPSYYARGTVFYNNGEWAPVSETRTVTLRCR